MLLNVPVKDAQGNTTYYSGDEAGYAKTQQESGTPAGAAPTIPTTPTVVSSKDLAGSYADNVTKLSTKGGTITPSYSPVYDTKNNITGYNVTDASGKVTFQSSNPLAPDATGGKTGTDAGSTAVEKGASKGVGTGEIPAVSTGDPIYDSLQNWEQSQQQKNEADASAKKQQVQDMLKTNLSNTDASFAAQIATIGQTFAGLIDTQNRINDLNIGRVKAYGLASGNAMSTPLEFTNAVSNEEQASLKKIGDLDTQRDNAIATAKAAQQSADAKLLSDSMDAVDKIEKDMSDAATALQKQVDDRFTTLNKIKDDQAAQLKLTQQNLLAAAVTNYGLEYSNETDTAKRDALIKKIVTESGGQLDYGTVFGSLSSNATALATKKTQEAKDAADLKLKGAQTAEAFANAAKTSAATAQAATFSAIDDRLQPGITSPVTKGMPYLDKSGYMTKGGFDELLQGAHQKNINRSTFLKEYAGYLDPNALGSYGLTKAEQDAINNINKVTPIVIPGTTPNPVDNSPGGSSTG